VRWYTQRYLDRCQNAEGQELHDMYYTQMASLRRQILMLQYGRQNNLKVFYGRSEEELQQKLDHMKLISPEEYCAEMIAEYRKRLGPADQFGKLEFRIAPASVESSRVPGPFTPEQEQAYRQHLQEYGPRKPFSKVQQYLWLPLHARTAEPTAVTEDYQGRKYVLVSNKSDQIMTADGSWGVQAAYPDKDWMGRRAIGLELDEAGGEKLLPITLNRVDQTLAIVLDGQVLSVPRINAPLRNRALITGKFTEREIRRMIIALQKGMPAQKPAASSESDP
jgi:hypothetical protein